MGIEDCIKRVIDASGGLIGRGQAMSMIETTVKKIDSGIAPQKLIKEAMSIAEQRKEALASMRRYNVIRDFTMRKEKVNGILEFALDTKSPEGISQKFIKMLGYDSRKARLKQGLYDMVRNHEQWHRQLSDSAKQDLDGTLRKAGLIDFAKETKNAPDIIREIAAQNVKGDKPVGSVTGNKDAFAVGKEIARVIGDLRSRKVRSGSTIAFLDGFVTSNMWDAGKLARMTDDEFFNHVKDFDWGDKGTKADWIEFKNKVVAGNHIDIEDELLGGKVANAEFAGATAGGSLAEYAGLSRQIQLTTDQYISAADSLFRGESFIDRIGAQIERDSRVVADLEFFGSKPRQQFSDIVNQLIAKTRDDSDFISKDIFGETKHILKDDFHFGTNGQDSILAKAAFRDISNPSNTSFAGVMNTMRNANALISLSGSAITAQMDVVTRALRTAMLTSDIKEGNMFTGIVDAYRDNIRQFGKGRADAELKGFSTGVATLFDDMMADFRYYSPDELQHTAGGLRKVDQFINKAFKFNMLEKVTDINLRATYNSAMGIFGSYKDVPLNGLNDELQILFKNSNLKDTEWDFIRSKAGTKSQFGDELLAVEKIRDLDLEDFRALNPGAKTVAGLEKTKSDLMSKWNTILYREAKTMTIMPDVLDRARLTRGLRPGTVFGELARTSLQFKSFAFAFTARILQPLLTRGGAATQAEFLAAATSMAMLVTSAKDLASGRSPRDFTKPENMIGVTGLVVGVPFIDQLAFALSNDNPQASHISEIITGPILGDLFETTARTTELFQDIIDGEDPNLPKFIGRTILPKTPFRNFPGLAIPYNMLYNGIMEQASPGFKRRAKKNLEDRGSFDLTGTL